MDEKSFSGAPSRRCSLQLTVVRVFSSALAVKSLTLLTYFVCGLSRVVSPIKRAFQKATHGARACKAQTSYCREWWSPSQGLERSNRTLSGFLDGEIDFLGNHQVYRV